MFKKLFYNSPYSHKSVVRDLLLWLILLVFVTAGIATAGYFTYSKRNSTIQMNRRADMLVNEISTMLSVPLYNIDHDGVQHICSIYMQVHDLMGILVEDEQGEKVFDIMEQKGEGFIRTAEVKKAELPLGRVSLLISCEYYEKQLNQTLWAIFLTVLLICTVMVAGIHFIMQYILIRPLQRFNKGLLQIADGNYSTRLETVKHVDLNASVDAVNSMAEKIEKVIGEVSQTRDFLQNVIDSMPSAMIVVDRDARIISMNFSASKHVQSTSRYEGNILADVFPNLENIQEHISLAIIKGKPIIAEQKKCLFLGKKKSAEITIFPLRASVFDGAVIRVDDITSRIRLQEVMVHTGKMISVGGLGAGMAHEINNPLGGILQATQNIERRLSPELKKNSEVASDCGVDLKNIIQYLDNREIFSMLTGIRDAGQRAAKIVQNMLQFSRHSETVMKPCVLAEILDRVVELASNDLDMKRKYDFKNFNVIRNYRHDIEIVCARTEVEQVFLNLLKNAAQSYGPVGSDQGAKPEITINVFHDDDWITVEVVDYGKGMAEDIQKRIFEPFFTTKKVGEGTGLGLAVSYFIVVEQHSGRLLVESAPGKGAVFTVKFPKH